MSSSAFGFIGAGAITAAIVEGISTNVADPPTILLSPRSRDIADDLSRRFPNVQVSDTNQDVLDNAASTVIAVRPQVCREVLSQLTFSQQHVVLSVVAGIPLSQLARLAAPASDIVRAIPLPSAARAKSLTAMYPENAVARDLFGRVGGVVVPDQEATLEAFSAATATFAAHLDYLSTIAAWLADHGVHLQEANDYIAHIFGQLGQSLQGDASLNTLTDKHMTPGGLNQQLLTDLREEGMPDMVRRALDRVLARVRA